MKWTEAIELVIARTAHERYRELCHESHPEHEQWREIVVRRAQDQSGLPPLRTQAANLGQSLWSWAVSGFSMASDEEFSRRITICESCEHWLPEERRCGKCACYMDVKALIKTSHCPLEPPKW